MRRTYLLNVLVAILLVAGLLVPSTATASSSTTVKLWIGNASMSVNGVQQLIDVQGTKPVIVAGRTLVPIRAVIEAFGGSAAWEASTRKATVTLGKNSLDLWIDKPQASLNGTALAIDSANAAVVPVITNGRTMLPLRFVAESLGIDVQYDATTKMITLTYSPVVTPPVVTPPVVTPLFTLTVLSPSGGEVWAAGTTHMITWAVSGDMSAVKQFLLGYSTSDGKDLKSLCTDAAGNFAPSTARSFLWTVPDTPSPTCIVLIVPLNSSMAELPGTCWSYRLFTIAPPVAPAAKSWQQVTEFTGDSTKTTQPFTIESGEWRITWTATPGTYGDGNFVIYLYSADGNMVSVAANVIGEGGDTSYVYTSGTYYLSIIAVENYDIVIEQYN